MINIPPVMTRKEVQKILRTSKATVLKLINSGELEAFTIGNSYRITREALFEYMRSSHFKIKL